MALPDLTGLNIQDTYQRLLQRSGSGDITDGTGSLFIPPTASFAISASYAVSSSHEIIKEISSSHADIADGLTGQPSIHVTDVTASGDISASGDLVVNAINAKSNVLITGSFAQNSQTLEIRQVNSTISGKYSGAQGRFIGLNSDTVIIGNDTHADGILLSNPVTASGDISSSGTIVGSNLSGTNTGDQDLSNLAITGSDVIFNNITASGDISSSGVITAEGLVISDDASISDELTVTGNITSSANISANRFVGDGRELFNLPQDLVWDGEINDGQLQIITNASFDTAPGTSRFENIKTSSLEYNSNGGLLAGITDPVIYVKDNGGNEHTINANLVSGNGTIIFSGSGFAMDATLKAVGESAGLFHFIDMKQLNPTSAGTITDVRLLGAIRDKLIELQGNSTFNAAQFNYQIQDSYEKIYLAQDTMPQQIAVSSLYTSIPENTKVLSFHYFLSASAARGGNTGVGAPNVFVQTTRQNKVYSSLRTDLDTVFRSASVTIEGPTSNLEVGGDGLTVNGNTVFGNAGTDLHTFTGNITASANISASGTIIAPNLIADSASFSTRVTANDAKVSYTDAAVTSVINTAGVISSSAQFGSSDNVTFGTIEATSLNVTSITSSIVTSSIVQTEGSNIFGDAISDTQTFNGHITASGDISASGEFIGAHPILIGDTLIDGGDLTIGQAGSISSGGGSVKLRFNAPGTGYEDIILFDHGNTNKWIMGTQAGTNDFMIAKEATTLTGTDPVLSIAGTGDITASGDISASGTITTENLTVHNTFLANRLDRIDNVKIGVEFNDGINVSGGHITASGNISASGKIITNVVDPLGGNLLTLGDIDGNNAGVRIELNQSTNKVEVKNADLVVGVADSNVQSLVVTNHITASGNISASGNIQALTGSFENYEGSFFSVTPTVMRFGDLLSSGNGTEINLNDTAGAINFGALNGTQKSITLSSKDLIITDENDTNTQRTEIRGSITASGDISASGIFVGNELNFAGPGTGNDYIKLINNTINLKSDNNSISLTGNVTASGNISASGEVFVGDRLYINNKEALDDLGTLLGINEQANFTGVQINRPNAPNPIVLYGNTTASGDISGSSTSNITVGGTITAEQITSTDDITATGTVQAEHLFSTDDAQINDDLYIGDNIIHLDDTDTKIAFGTNTVQVDAGGTTVFESSITGSTLSNVDKNVYSTSSVALEENGAIGDIVKFGNITTTPGAIYHLNHSASGGWTLADADHHDLATGSIAVAVGTNSTTDGMCLRGIINPSADPNMPIGAPCYLQTTPGRLGPTPPSGTGDVVRIVGYKFPGAAPRFYFNPSNDFIIHA